MASRRPPIVLPPLPPISRGSEWDQDNQTAGRRLDVVCGTIVIVSLLVIGFMAGRAESDAQGRTHDAAERRGLTGSHR